MKHRFEGWRRFGMALCLSAGVVGVQEAQADAGAKFGLGREAKPAEIAAWDIDVRPDGLGLPKGKGDVAAGETLFIEQCASCHGDFGEGVDRWPVLAGGQGTLTEERPEKTVGSYWPYLSTVWDYVHRAMPFGNAQSLSDDEVYAITAYILYANDLVDEDFELSHENFAAIRLPNEANFFMDDREKSPLWGPREVCMQDCKPEAKITMRAAVLDVTPEEGAAAAAATEANAPAQPAAQAVSEATSEASWDAALVEAGEKVFKKQCKRCHQVGDGAKNRTGPILTNSFGAPVAAVDGFRYSKALREKAEEGAVWDAATLDLFLKKPKAWAKRTKMSYAGLKKDQDRVALIEYLKSVAQ